MFLFYIRSWGKYFKRMGYEDCTILVFGLEFFKGICIFAKVNLSNNHLRQVFLLHPLITIPYNVQYVVLKLALPVAFSVHFLCSFLLGVQKSQQFHVWCEHKED